MTAGEIGPPNGPRSRPLPPAPLSDHGGLLLYRLYHPTGGTPTADTMRAWGPLYRFDPHAAPADAPAADPRDPPVWYGSESLETSIREVFGRGLAEVGVCARYRMAAVRLAQPSLLLDLTVDAVGLGAPDDLGDRVAGLDYDVTRAWARAIHADLAPDGLRYHSARHRDPAGGRVGVNVVLWNPAVVDEVVSDVAVGQAGAWQRLLAVLDRAGVAVERLAHCSRCAL